MIRRDIRSGYTAAAPVEVAFSCSVTETTVYLSVDPSPDDIVIDDVEITGRSDTSSL
jgi:hypothetical protein